MEREEEQQGCLVEMMPHSNCYNSIAATESVKHFCTESLMKERCSVLRVASFAVFAPCLKPST